MLVCINCKQGLMDPIRSDEEPEYTDRYQCGHCGHVDTIPSMLIITSQLVSALLGGAITGYLLQKHLLELIAVVQQEQPGSMELAQHGGLSAFALFMLAGFIYTLLRAIGNLRIRHHYRHPG